MTTMSLLWRNIDSNVVWTILVSDKHLADQYGGLKYQFRSQTHYP